MKRIGVDIGGTFTDIVYFDDETMQITTNKVRSTPDDVGRAVIQVIDKIKANMADVNQFIHGTTVGLNTLLERKGSKVGLITTQGFTDVLEMARGDKKELYNYLWKKPKPLVPRHLRFGVKERMNSKGQILIELDGDEVKDITKKLRESGVEAIAVSLLHSYANPEHELRVEKIIREEWPEVILSLSHEIAREFREYERTSTTVIDAYTKKKVVQYLQKLGINLKNKGFTGQLLISGPSGVIGTGSAIKNSIFTMDSGPTGGAVGAARLANLTGFKDLLLMDVGGTSFDVAVIKDGKNIEKHETELMGLPALVQSIDIRSIGAGGGSIAKVDAGGLLTVGPESAGGNPGPMCYGLGGTKPTVTDAALVNGIIDPHYFLGGDYALNIDLAKKGVGEIAQRLGLSLNEAASGILTLARNNMTTASSEILLGQGYDPRDFAILSYGGGGGYFAVDIAKDIGTPNVIIPPAPGVFCAWGMLGMNIVHTYSRTYSRSINDLNMLELESIFNETEKSALETLKEEGIVGDGVEMVRSIDMAYAGQGHYVDVPLPGKGLRDYPKTNINESFHRNHEIKYGHRLEAPVRVINVRLKAVGKLKEIPINEIKQGKEISQSAIKPKRQVFLGGRFIECPIYERGQLLWGNTIPGPAIIEEPQHTTIMMPGQTLKVDKWGNLIIDLRGA
jgi:N-methylhydantoinase A